MKATTPIKATNAVSAIITTLAISSLALLAGCQSIQPYDGTTGYQRQSSSTNQLILSYTLDGKSTDAITQQKLKKACAKELGLALNTPVSINIIDQKEFANLKQGQADSTVRVANTQSTSFGLSSTPKLSNTSNTANIDLLGSKPSTLKQVTVECLQP